MTGNGWSALSPFSDFHRPPGQCNRDVTTTDLMLHRIANQWGYNLASRSMDLQAVAFPALVAADDGRLQYLSEAEESVWTTVCNQEVQQATCRFSTTATIELEASGRHQSREACGFVRKTSREKGYSQPIASPRE